MVVGKFEVVPLRDSNEGHFGNSRGIPTQTSK